MRPPTGFTIPPALWLVIILFGGALALLVLAYAINGVAYALGFIRVWRDFVSRNALRDVPDIHPWFSNIAKIPLSEEALRRIEPRLVKRTNETVGVQRVLERGDGRAAVVISTDPLVIAAYSDAFDGVVLLRFNAKTIGRELNLGDRLLAAIGYLWLLVDINPRPHAPDLEVGPNGVHQFENFVALIADFLTDDSAALQSAKAKITEEEWERAWDLGYARLEAGHAPRDGRPSRCHRPASGNFAWARALVVALAKGEDYDDAPGPPPGHKPPPPKRRVVVRRR